MLTGGFAVTRAITGLPGGYSPEATFDEQLAASQLFFQVNAIALFVRFLVTVWAHLKMGRDSPRVGYAGPVRVWTRGKQPSLHRRSSH